MNVCEFHPLSSHMMSTTVVVVDVDIVGVSFELCGCVGVCTSHCHIPMWKIQRKIGGKVARVYASNGRRVY